MLRREKIRKRRILTDLTFRGIDRAAENRKKLILQRIFLKATKRRMRLKGKRDMNQRATEQFRFLRVLKVRPIPATTMSLGGRFEYKAKIDKGNSELGILPH